MLIIFSVLGLLFIVAWTILSLPQFGKHPSGVRLERIKQSPHYTHNKFNNIHHTPQFAEGVSFIQVLYRFLFKKTNNKTPEKPFSFSKTTLQSLPLSDNILVWMGHSSYFLQTGGKRFLIDPVFSGYSSPFSFITKAFKGTDNYTVDDIPPLDYLVITHDHWDHLDYHTVKKLIPKVKHIITGLGTGEHLEYWGYDPKIITELDWYEKADLGNGFEINCEPARHFSGRGLKRDKAIWASFLLQTPTQKIYIGGDSGYDDHFQKIGEKYKHIDLAILELGQYNEDWKYIHMLPGEQLKAMKELHAQRLFPVHNSKFALAAHPWNEPIIKITELNTDSLRILTPKIGEKVDWADDTKVYEKWWEAYK